MNILATELKDLEGILYQNPETGAKVDDDTSFVSDYTTRVFGAPFQMMKSVDNRLVNDDVGSQYLRNILLNSPILYVKPGMPFYTGGTSPNDLWNGIRKSFMDNISGNMSRVDSLLENMAGSLIFGAGSKLQRRMFGFRETYYDYMQHANYMCRSMAILLNLTTTDEYPSGAHVGPDNTFMEFQDFKWQDYRLLKSSTATDPWDYLQSLQAAAAISAVDALVDIGEGMVNIAHFLNPFDGLENLFDDTNRLINAFHNAADKTIRGAAEDKITSVQFIVEPTSFNESLTNKVTNSAIEDMIDSVTGIGKEIGFITNSNADLGMIEDMAGMLGSTIEGLSTGLSGLLEPVAGGFLGNLATGAIQSIKGQKMIYPMIYESSESGMNYQYTCTLTSPYGDVYNYYMNIVVPLMHLICLAAPRMVTANTIASPYLVQAYIPGQTTCHLGMITHMDIQKNPNTNHVSVNGFPLTVKVTFTITELYNAMSISPANDPASFLFNETLNDYMSNMAGLVPSLDTYTNQRHAMLENLGNYISFDGFKNDAAEMLITKVEDTLNPFIGR